MVLNIVFIAWNRLWRAFLAGAGSLRTVGPGRGGDTEPDSDDGHARLFICSVRSGGHHLI